MFGIGRVPGLIFSTKPLVRAIRREQLSAVCYLLQGKCLSENSSLTQEALVKQYGCNWVNLGNANGEVPVRLMNTMVEGPKMSKTSNQAAHAADSPRHLQSRSGNVIRT